MLRVLRSIIFIRKNYYYTVKYYFKLFLPLLVVIIISTVLVWTSTSSASDDVPKKTQTQVWKGNQAFQFIKAKYPQEAAQLNETAFNNTYIAMLNLKKEAIIPQDNNIITICDFSLSSNEKRMWIIDVAQLDIRMHSLVSHGRNTGEEYATVFSNTLNSYQSSLGVYVATETYQGSNGYSLRLKGMDPGLNDRAEERAIVLHGAAYCSEDFIKQHGRLGRSFGCPAVPVAVHEDVINTIKDKTVLYIYHKDFSVLASSTWVHLPQELGTAAHNTVIQ